MNSDQSQPLIDFSDAKEPTRSLEQKKDTVPPESGSLEQKKDTVPPESESLEQKQLSDDLNDPEKSGESVGERQTIIANIPGGAAYSIKEDRY